jgi:hypothetical protein
MGVGSKRTRRLRKNSMSRMLETLPSMRFLRDRYWSRWIRIEMISKLQESRHTLANWLRGTVPSWALVEVRLAINC